jgi:hypothetical protein
MPDPRRLDDQEATRRRRAWLQERHAQARELVILLLRHAPEAEVARVLDQLPAGDLQRLARLLTQATDPAEVARRITADPTTPSRPRRHPDRPQ